MPRLRIPALLLVLASSAAAQGSLAPPRGWFGPGVGDATGGGVGDPAGFGVTDQGSWTRWWDFNREPFLASLRPPGSRVSPTRIGAEPPEPPPYRPDELTIHTEVVPVLLAHLNETKDLDLKAACLMALGKIGDPPRALTRKGSLSRVGPAIEKHLTDSNERVRDIAVLALGILDGPKPRLLLSAIASDRTEDLEGLGKRSFDRRTRAFATLALSRHGYRTHRLSQRTSVSAALIELAKENRRDADIATAAVLGLGWCPLPITGDDTKEGLETQVAALIALLEHDLTDIRAKAQIPVALARLVTWPGPVREVEGATIVREALRVDVVTRLNALVAARGGHKNASVREGAVQALGIVTRPATDGVDRSAAESLVRIGDSGQERESGLAMIAIARVAGRSGKGDAPAIREVALELQRELVKQADNGPSSRRGWAVLALGLTDRLSQTNGVEPSEGLQELMRERLAGSGSPEAVAAAAIGLGLAGSRDDAGTIASGLDQGDFHIRGLRAMALALLGHRASIPKLQSIVAEPLERPYLLREMSTALALLSDGDLVRLLLQKLIRTRFMPERIAVVSSLAWVKDPGALPSLRTILVAERVARRRLDDTTRAFAASAIGALCSREAMPWNAHFALDLVWSAAPPSLTDPRAGGGALDLL